MRVALRSMTPGYRGMATCAFAGTGLLWGAALLEGGNSINFLLSFWLVWLVILFAPFCHVVAYLGIKYFHLTSHIKSETRRKSVTDSIRFWILWSGFFSLIYVELEGDQEAVAYLASYFAEVPDFQVRLQLFVTREGEEHNVLKLFSDEVISRGMAVTENVNVVALSGGGRFVGDAKQSPGRDAGIGKKRA